MWHENDNQDHQTRFIHKNNMFETKMNKTIATSNWQCIGEQDNKQLEVDDLKS
jgi:hypothetical protein